MSFIYKHASLLLVAVSCAGLGAGASAITSASAATGSSGHAAKRGQRTGELRRLAARGVQGTVVVHTKTGFATVSFERGRVDSVSGRQLTLTEGTRKASYKTVTLTIPAGARVRDQGRRATLSDVTPGQRVLVLAVPKRTFVIAHTPRTA